MQLDIYRFLAAVVEETDDHVLQPLGYVVYLVGKNGVEIEADEMTALLEALTVAGKPCAEYLLADPRRLAAILHGRFE